MHKQRIKINGDGLRIHRILSLFKWVIQTQNHASTVSQNTVVLYGQQVDVDWQLSDISSATHVNTYIMSIYSLTLTGWLRELYRTTLFWINSCGVPVRGVKLSKGGNVKRRVFQRCSSGELAAVSKVIRCVPGAQCQQQQNKSTSSNLSPQARVQ